MEAEKTAVNLAVWILLLSGFAGVVISWFWYLTGAPMSQYMPAGQTAGVYLLAGVLGSFLKSRTK